MKHSSMDYQHLIVMFFIMILSGFLSTMNVWVDKVEDIRFSINDLYMTLLMTGWMFLFMGVFYRNFAVSMFGLILVSANLWFIRHQFLVSETQYRLGMIPHHSMAVHLSKRLLENHPDNRIRALLQQIIDTQENEIKVFKQNSA